MKEIIVPTQERFQLVDITEKAREAVVENNKEKGFLLVFVLHTTAGIIITENEEDLKKDWLRILKKIVSGIDFFHNRIDNNADSHILAGLVGQHKIIPIKDKDLLLGKWQSLFLAEFDGPRERKIIIEVF